MRHGVGSGLVVAAVTAMLPHMGSAQEDGALPVPLTCLIVPDRLSHIGTDRTGIVTEVAVRRADQVTAGQLLVRLDQRAVLADLAQTQIRIEALTARIARSERLGSNALIAADELDQLRTELALAQGEAARSELDLSRLEIRAPFDGVVADVLVTEGELTGPNPLLLLMEVQTVRAELVYLDDAFGRITPGSELDLAVDLARETVNAIATAVDPFLDPASNSFMVVARIDNRDLGLQTGVSCRVVG